MKAAALAITILALSGCATGNLVVSPPSAGPAAKPVAGIVGGGLVASVDLDLTRSERVAAINAEYRTLESTPAGQPVSWRGEKTGHGGTVTASQPYRVGSQDCRPYSHIINAAGATRSVRGTACRNPDGSWTLLN